MKVAFVAPMVRSAMGQYINALLEFLADHHEIHLFVPHHYQGDLDKVTVHRYYTGQSKYEAMLRLGNPYLGWQVWRQIQQLKPDLIHAFNGEGYPWTAMWAKLANKHAIPLVVTVHDPEPHPGNFWESANAIIRSLTLPSASVVHLHSNRFAHFLKPQGVEPDQIFTIPHGSLGRHFLNKSQPGIQKEAMVLLFGRLEAYKGIDILVEAAQHLKGQYKICIAGPGKLPSELEQKILENPDLFEFQNRFLSDEDVAILFQRAAVCVLPYKQATQSSLPMIAASFGVAVVASAVGNFIDEIPLVNGVLIAPNDPIVLAQGILEAATRKPHYPTEYEFKNLVHLYSEMYDNALNKIHSYQLA
jgi:glycosyltransferase involved in cell wall biosynthesis